MSYENIPKNASETRVLTEGVPYDYFVELARGKVDGASGTGRVAVGVVDDSGYLPVWGGSTAMVFPTAAEIWELVSDDANDTLAGTGARTVLVNYLDDTYTEQTAIVNLNGTTGVQVGTDCFRPMSMVVIASGSGKANMGTLTLQVSGGGNPRSYIMPTIAVAQDTFFTVPAGKTILLTKVSPYLGKDDSGNIKGKMEFFGTNTTITNGIFPVYQNTYDVGFEVPFPFPEKTDVWYEFISNSPTPTTVNVVLEYIVLDEVV